MTEENQTDNTMETGGPLPPDDMPLPPPLYKFHLVLAEVIFDCELGIQTRRTQFMVRSTDDCFPHARIVQTQEVAAKTVGQEVIQGSGGAIKNVTVQAVYILALNDLGWMTAEQFENAQMLVLPSNDPVAQDETGAALEELAETADNVIPIRPA